MNLMITFPKLKALFHSLKLKVALVTFAFFLLHFANVSAQQVAILKYNGGGDWYANPTALPNLIKFCNKNIKTSIKEISSIML